MGNLERKFGEEYRNPIKSWFHVTSTPYGQAPIGIRNQWVGVQLPLRYDKPMEAPDPGVTESIYTRERVLYEDRVRIVPHDGVKSLRIFGRPEAAKFWQDLVDRKGVSELIFKMEEGVWLPNDLILKKFPQLENFDQQ